MIKCKCWEELVTIKGWNGNKNLYNYKQICNGTKEREECDCDGDINKCNFYLKNKEKNKMTTIEMINQANKDNKTYKANNIRYNNKLGFHVNDKNKWERDVCIYMNDIFNINTWEIANNNETTKSE